MRFVTLYNGAFAMGEGRLNWDGHQRIKSDYDRHGPILDKPAAALADRPEIARLARRDARRLDDRIRPHAHVPERAPRARPQPQGVHGLARRRRGQARVFSFGATDQFGYQAVENVVDVHDFHATVLHLLGLNHETLTYYHNGLQRRLTDVHGRLIREILA